MENIIEVRDLKKIFDKNIRAVDGVSFDVKEGEIFGFLGPNGAGKSTTISMITTLLTPTSGQIVIDGKDSVKSAKQVRKTIGLVPQALTADDQLSGRENMQLQADLYDVPKNVAKERIDELLSIVKLEEAADRRVDTYSGGMRKRLELAEGLIHHPKILFLDEPTLGLDIQTREIIWEYITNIKKQSGMTVFLTTHYLEEAESLCDRIAIIDRGKIIVIGTPDELKASLGGDLIEIEVDESQECRNTLRSIPGIDEIEYKDGKYILRTPNGDNAMESILSRIAEERWKIKNISLQKPSMNQVFLKYTGKSLRDDAGKMDKFAARAAAAQNRRRR
ncbi:ATP-binding cassette domain-containing protein [Candidatus Methanomassiliicoccus intestinalis]|jgi:daunorubicin resistance ABC transporter, ATP-binding protein|uniref:Daunorubicin resistance ABC transporter ATPase n=2 Tax=Candidatus Methanomassiliicoccus intestinalis TaxID=1406512 RepID=R9T8I0_METII|nr:ATP-binding cassette domain-containing protein [Candidatus Methanomassiliicoccus intestinalis]AGN27010.1 daunorubicin resistance ABC transporter ATPase [Candidatus Methanomassiliicoccus intestinalis Issoire-Mx1]TQS81011.1 MAG: ABC transporter ATP-binding protein [Candidatus Methanomassiliicoccus intestinalis]TQS84005.1 MAG: ABC transporter ATP-binding protein [Candidatus Methanomassiliicoccus intestinalis]